MNISEMYKLSYPDARRQARRGDVVQSVEEWLRQSHGLARPVALSRCHVRILSLVFYRSGFIPLIFDSRLSIPPTIPSQVFGSRAESLRSWGFGFVCEGGEGIGVMNKFNSSNTNTEITQQQETKRKTKKPQNKKRTKKASSSSSIPSSGDGASLRQLILTKWTPSQWRIHNWTTENLNKFFKNLKIWKNKTIPWEEMYDIRRQIKDAYWEHTRLLIE